MNRSFCVVLLCVVTTSVVPGKSIAQEPNLYFPKPKAGEKLVRLFSETPTSMFFEPTNRWLFVGFGDGAIVPCQMRGKYVFRQGGFVQDKLPGVVTSIVAPMPPGSPATFVATSGGNPGGGGRPGVWFFEYRTNPKDGTSKYHVVRELPATPKSILAVSPDNKMLAFPKVPTKNEHKICLWDLKNDKDLSSLEGHKSAMIISLSFSADGRQLLSVADSSSSKGKHEVKVWSVDGQLRASYLLPFAHKVGPKLRTGAEMYMATKDKLIVATKGGIIVKDLLSGEGDMVLKGYGENPRIAVSPDGKAIAHAAHDLFLKDKGKEFVSIFETETGKLLKVLPTKFRVTCLAYSQNGDYLAAGGRGNEPTVRIWPTEHKPAVLLSKARQAFDQGNTTLAITRLLRIVDEHPRSAEAGEAKRLLKKSSKGK